MTTTTLKSSCSDPHPIVAGLAEVAKSGSFADVKIVCDHGTIFWSHRLLLASVSPFLKSLLLAEEFKNDTVLTLQLPGIRASHLALVLDYLYTGAMYLTTPNLAGVLRVIEMLRMTCGVSVSKMVQQKHEEKWVEEAQFERLDQLSMKGNDQGYEEEEDIESGDVRKHEHFQKPSDFWLTSSEKAVEVKPLSDQDLKKVERNIYEAYSAVQIIEESDSDEEHFGNDSVHDEEVADKVNENFQCVMCSKAFLHEDNLKVHIKSHLGSTAQLQGCHPCRRNFRSSLELELHQNSHAFSKFRDIRRHVKAKSRAEREYLRLLKQAVRLLSLKDAQAKTATKAVETKQKVAKKSVKSKSKKKVQKSRSKTSKPATKPLNTSSRPIPAATDDPFKLKMKVKLKPLDLNALKKGASSRRKSATTPKPVAKKPKTPKSTKRRASAGQASTPVVPPAAKISKEDALTCPTCDKTFLAKSIFMRHLKTYKHGIYSSGTDPELSVSTPPAFIPHPTDKQLPHYNQVLQPTMEVGGREVNKYECHLCNKVFLRVKDLAKHREKTCSAWFGSN